MFPSESLSACLLHIFFFFFQAEDGIRDLTVTGVQTCALPIFTAHRADLHGLLQARLPASSIHLDAQCTGVSSVGGTAVATFADGREVEAEIGRASGRGRGEISVGGVSLKKKKRNKRVLVRRYQ